MSKFLKNPQALLRTWLRALDHFHPLMLPRTCLGALRHGFLLLKNEHDNNDHVHDHDHGFLLHKHIMHYDHEHDHNGLK